MREERTENTSLLSFTRTPVKTCYGLLSYIPSSYRTAPRTGSLGGESVPCDRLRAVHPSTFPSQPPPDCLDLSYTARDGRRVLGTKRDTLWPDRGRGVTFEALHKRLGELHRKICGKALDELTHETRETDGGRCDFSWPWAITTDSNEVKTAREAQVKAKPSAPPKEPSPEEAAILLEWLVETMDQLCPED